MSRQLPLVQQQLQHYRPFFELEPELLTANEPTISGWGISSHLDHTLRVTCAIVKAVAAGKELTGPGISLLGRLVLAIGYIPRGKAKSPASVSGQPSSVMELNGLWQAAANELQQIARGVDALGSKRLIAHPRFGALTAEQGLRFVIVHTNHHLKIAREILAVQRRQ